MLTIDLSEVALTLLHACASGEKPDVDPANLNPYRELAAAGIMYPVSGWASGPTMPGFGPGEFSVGSGGGVLGIGEE